MPQNPRVSRRSGRTLTCAAALASGLLLPAVATAQVDDQTRELAHGIFKQLIEINTTDADGNVSAAAEAMQQRLVDAGFAKADLFLGGPTERKKNLVVRYRGTGKNRPILFIGHLDVVGAPPEDWSTDPFKTSCPYPALKGVTRLVMCR